MTQEEVFSRIEEISSTARVNYIDAVIHFCSETGFEVESVAEMIKKNPRFRSKIKNVASSLRLLAEDRKGSRLPI